VILENLGEPADAEAVATKLVETLREPASIAGVSLQITVSVGLAVLEPGEADPASLLRRADKALYDAKRRGRNRYAVSRSVLASS
jgi:diguanylate cyclase (GGDEF)-like protein